ncbi:hypothetical protein HYD98_03510 [Mycoplasmopsis bovis]|nr:hypothetical protein HYD98_03510 [Mycoplasmopsis bovis]
MVFNQNKFAKFIDSKEFLEDSIHFLMLIKLALTSGDVVLSLDLASVVLDFPFKDCYLGGGSN